MDNIKRKRKLWFTCMLVATCVFILGMIIIIVLPIDLQIKLSLFLLFCILALIAFIYIRPRITYFNQVYAWLKIKETINPPLASNLKLNERSVSEKMLHKAYQIIANSDDFTIFYKYIAPNKELIHRKGTLQFFAIIKNEHIGYQNSEISKYIEHVEKDFYHKKMKFKNYMVFIGKYGTSYTDEIKKQTEQVVFDHHGLFHISTIPFFYHVSEKTYTFLYSDTFSPSVFYKGAALELIDILTKP